MRTETFLSESEETPGTTFDGMNATPKVATNIVSKVVPGEPSSDTGSETAKFLPECKTVFVEQSTFESLELHGDVGPR